MGYVRKLTSIILVFTPVVYETLSVMESLATNTPSPQKWNFSLRTWGLWVKAGQEYLPNGTSHTGLSKAVNTPSVKRQQQRQRHQEH